MSKQEEKLIKKFCTYKEFCKIVYNKLKITESYRFWYQKNNKILKLKYNEYVESSKSIVVEALKNEEKDKRIKEYKKIVPLFLLIISFWVIYYYTL